MRELNDAFQRAVTTVSCRMATLVGDAGVGKTRLTREFLDGAGRNARIVRGRCLPYGDGITFWPIVEIVRDAAEIGEGDPPDVAREDRIEALVGDRADHRSGRIRDRPAPDRRSRSPS